jgi:hypothetical protein
MVHWYFDEKVAAERMRERQGEADRVQLLGLHRREQTPGWLRLQVRLGQWLIALGESLQRGREIRRAGMTSSSQCGLR